MELRHLRYFVAVAEEGHVTRAAERLGIQQPPLSKQIAALERELDVRLLRRTARGVELTDAGRAFLDQARTILSGTEQAVETARRTARGEQGQIAVGVAPTGPFHPFLPRIIRAYREASPLVALTLEESFTNDLVERLRGEKLDVAFLRSPVRDVAGLIIDHLLDEPMVVALPSSHALATTNNDNEPIPLKALSGDTFIVYGRRLGPGFYDATVEACSAAGFDPRLGQEAPRITSTLGFVATGLGIALVPASMRRVSMDGVAYRRFTGPIQPTVALNMASRRGDPSAVVRQFVSLVRKFAKTFDEADSIASQI
jgi:DNA-binding transcriptional LysR family regulator